MVDRHHDVKNHLRRFDQLPGSVGVQVLRFVQRHPIDCDAVILVTAGDVITRHADHPFDQVSLGAVGQQVERLQGPADWVAGGRLWPHPLPRRILEDHDVTALKTGQPHGNDAVLLLQRALHRSAGHLEDLEDEDPEQRGDDQGDQDRQTSFGHKREELAERRRAAVFGIAFGIGTVQFVAGASDGQPGLRPADEMAALLLHFVTPRLDGRGVHPTRPQ